MHRMLHKLSTNYGPIISLKLRSRFSVVISSLSAAEECFTTNDITLANRPKLIFTDQINSDNNIVWVPYGDHWRNLRRIGSVEIFSSNRLNLFVNSRRDEVKRLLLDLYRNSCHKFAKVELHSKFPNLTFNIMMQMVVGKRDSSSDEERIGQFRKAIEEILSYSANPEDFFPILGWINGGKFEKKVKHLSKTIDEFLQGLINERRVKELGFKSSAAMIDHLLRLQKSDPNYYTDDVIKGLMGAMVVGGTDTTRLSLEWTMSSLVNHPDILKKAKSEIYSHIGQERFLEESDLPKLLYLKNVILESLRLYPPFSLIPHYSSNGCTIGGYNVPSDTIVFINIWAINRDPTVWNDQTSFQPERFDNIKGQTYNRIMSFGIGRRACPGEGLALRGLGLALGSLIQCFEWKRVDDKPINMTESNGRSTHMCRSEPLEVMCKANRLISKILDETC